MADVTAFHSERRRVFPKSDSRVGPEDLFSKKVRVPDGNVSTPSSWRSSKLSRLRIPCLHPQKSYLSSMWLNHQV